MARARSSDKHEKQIRIDDLDEIDGLFADDDLVDQHHTGARAPRIVALVCPKGGTGKTSIAIMLAGLIGSGRRKSALIDLDPRGSAHRWAEAGCGLPFPVHGFEARHGAAAFRRTMLAAARDIDLLVLDTPPAMDAAAHLALQVADLVLVPTGASKLDLAAMQETLEAAKAARHGRDGELPRVMVVPSRLDSRTRLARQFGRRLAELEVPVAATIGQRVEVAAAAGAGRLVRSGSLAGQEFRRLARDVWSLLRDLDA